MFSIGDLFVIRYNVGISLFEGDCKRGFITVDYNKLLLEFSKINNCEIDYAKYKTGMFYIERDEVFLLSLIGCRTREVAENMGAEKLLVFSLPERHIFVVENERSWDYLIRDSVVEIVE